MTDRLPAIRTYLKRLLPWLILADILYLIWFFWYSEVHLSAAGMVVVLILFLARRD